jgi:uncharacterized membrane protein YgdD (TMEM256/DUF423 family)
MERTFIIIGSILMFLAVGAGAFGAHGLSAHFARHPNLAATYDTAVRYHLIHGLAILVVAVTAVRWPGALTNLAGYLFLAGIILFSGSLYILTFTGIRWLGAITPFGGVAFLTGWLCLVLVAWRGV